MKNALVPLTTERLSIRVFRLDDLDEVYETLGPETSGGRIFEKKTKEEAEQWLRNRMAEQETHGYSIWAIERSNQEVIGVCGLIPWEPKPMICYAIRKKFQGHDYGAEVAGAVITRAAEEFGQVISTVRRSNVASVRVAEKIGMRPSEVAFSDDADLLSFVFP